MRDINRIDNFLKRLGDCWKKYPDFRFGQMMSNVLGSYQQEHGDIFFPEDEEMISYFEKWFKERI